jgi:ParB-like chromosome segregation protein Spo0J
MTETTTIRIEDVYPHPQHYREVRPENVTLLAANIGVIGQLEPIRVWQDGDVYIVDAGHHRLEAMKTLGRETIEAIVIPADDPAAMVAGNLHFEESELERSRGTQLLLTTGVKPEDAAALVGRDAGLVARAARGYKRGNDATAAEDMTLDRLAAIADVEDDEEAVRKLLVAAEGEWRSIYNAITTEKRLAADIIAKTAIAVAAGCTLIEQVDFKTMQYLNRSNEAPEGAKWAQVRPIYWSGNAEIQWYGDITEAITPVETEAQAKKREAREAEARALDEAHAARVNFIAPNIEMHYRLRKVAAAQVELDPEWSDVGDSATARFTAYFLSELEDEMEDLLREPDNDWQLREYGPRVDDYLKALAADGYEPTEDETERIKAFRAALKPAKKKKGDSK